MDPFSLVYTALYELVIASPRLTELVKVGNRIRFDSATDRDPLKQNVLDADTPELILADQAVTVNLHGTSSGTKIVRQYAFLLATGDMRINERLHPVEFALCCALSRWKESLTALQWEGRSFVKRLDVTSVAQGQSDPERNRGIKGWSAVWQCEVEMYLSTADMIAYAAGGS